jgi:hypothetical protein
MIVQQWTGNDVEKGGCDLVEVLSQNLPGETKEYDKETSE